MSIDKNTTLYLSGPISGQPEENRQAFEDAEHRLRSLGFNVINPFHLAEPEPQDGDTSAQKWAAYLARDIHFLVKTHQTATTPVPVAVVILAGWRYSRGSCLEVAVAEQFGIPVYTFGYVLAESKQPYSFPWPKAKETTNADVR